MTGSSAGSPNNCPTCGAPLSGPSSERCDYCGASLRSPAADLNRNLSSAMSASRKVWRRSWIYTGVVLGASLLVGVVGQFGTRQAVRRSSEASQPSSGNGARQPSAANQNKPKSHELSELLATLSPATGDPKVLFSTTPPGAIALLDAATSQQLWNATPASERVSPDAVVVIGERILVVTQSSVVALQIRDGSIEWQASLVADYSQFGNPAKVLSERLLVQLRDGTTQAFDINTGKTVWSVKQPPPSTQWRAAGDVLVDIRYNGKKRKKPLEVFVSDVATGQETHVFAPRCSTHSVIPANEPSLSVPALLSEDGSDLYLFYGFNRFCIDRWNLRSGKLVWQTNRNDGFVDSSPRELRFLMDDERIVYVGTDGVYQVRRRNGEVTKIVDREQNKLVPTYLKDNLLVLGAGFSYDQGGDG